MIIKVSTGKVATKHQLDDECSFLALVEALAEWTTLAAGEIEVLVGFPQKKLKPSDVRALARGMGVENGTTITVRSNPQMRDIVLTLREMGFSESLITEVMHSIVNVDLEEALSYCERLQPSSPAQGGVVVWSIPADNSCLFSAIDFLISELTPVRGAMAYRQLVADAISHDPETFNDEFLGKNRNDYIRWILNPDKWGGEIELSILSQQLSIEIAVIDIQSQSTLVYGTGRGFTRRIFLLYDGSHYDAIVRSSCPRSLRDGTRPSLSKVQRCFPSPSEAVLQEAKAIAAEKKRQKQFTNLASGSLMCKQCGMVLSGQSSAVQHAKQTGHTNFGEVA